MTEQEKYYYTIDQTGHGEGFAVCSPDHGQMAYLSYEGLDGEKEAEADARLIVDALKALTLIGNACQVQANLNSTATHEERSKFINSIFHAWNAMLAPLMEEGLVAYEDDELTCDKGQAKCG